MPEVDQHCEQAAARPDPAGQPRLTESVKFFEAERREEARKRFATYSLWVGLLSLLLLLIPNPFAPFAGATAILLGVHAMARILWQPARHAGTLRAVLGIAMGSVAVLVSIHA
jgi:hypothetical protein